jgi:signal transduction histidine kinase
VLEPFTRGTTTAADGTGLGLAIVAQQVTLHQGRLELGESELGGLRVEVRLPVSTQMH